MKIPSPTFPFSGTILPLWQCPQNAYFMTLLPLDPEFKCVVENGENNQVQSELLKWTQGDCWAKRIERAGNKLFSFSSWVRYAVENSHGWPLYYGKVLPNKFRRVDIWRSGAVFRKTEEFKCETWIQPLKFEYQQVHDSEGYAVSASLQKRRVGLSAFTPVVVMNRAWGSDGYRLSQPTEAVPKLIWPSVKQQISCRPPSAGEYFVTLDRSDLKRNAITLRSAKLIMASQYGKTPCPIGGKISTVYAGGGIRFEPFTIDPSDPANLSISTRQCTINRYEHLTLSGSLVEVLWFIKMLAKPTGTLKFQGAGLYDFSHNI